MKTEAEVREELEKIVVDSAMEGQSPEVEGMMHALGWVIGRITKPSPSVYARMIYGKETDT